jgi:hypothetical protein
MLNASNAELWTNERIVAMVQDPLAPIVLHPQRQYSRADSLRAAPDMSDVSPSRSASALKELKRRHMIHIDPATERNRRPLVEMPADSTKAVTVFHLRGLLVTPPWP